MFFGLPLRTISATTDFVTSPCVGVAAQFDDTSPSLTSRVMSGSSENVTTSAGSPDSTARLWSPDGP